MLNNELKPCPFCGGQAELLDYTGRDAECKYHAAKIVCTVCRSSTREFVLNGYYGSKDTLDMVYAFWNCRSDINGTRVVGS